MPAVPDESFGASRKSVLFAVIAASVGVLVYGGLTSARGAGAAVDVAAVERRYLEAVVSASGVIVPQLSVDVSANIMGRVTRLAFDEGDRVAAGDFLLEIDPETRRAAVIQNEAAVEASRASRRQAEISVAAAQVTLEQAGADLVRQRRLWELRLVSRDAYDRAASTVALREADLRAREAEVAIRTQHIRRQEADLESARYELTKVTITAPISGVVTRRNIEEGETVVVGIRRSRLATIADLSVLEAEIEVGEAHIPSITLGQPAVVTIDAFPGEVFAATVTEIGNSPIGARWATMFKVVVTLDDTVAGVRPGFTCTVEISTAVRADALAIPIEAAAVRETVGGGGGAVSAAEGAEPRDTEGVFVFREGRAAFSPVTTGIAGERYFEVLAGVAEGDLVITGPFSEMRVLADGDYVRAMRRSPRR